MAHFKWRSEYIKFQYKQLINFLAYVFVPLALEPLDGALKGGTSQVQQAGGSGAEVAKKAVKL